MTPKAVLLFVSLVLLANPAHSTQIPLNKVKAVRHYAGSIIVQLENSFTPDQNCETHPSQGKFIALEWSSNPDDEKMLPTLLSAAVARNDVEFGTTGCTSWGPYQIEKVYRVGVNY